MKRILFYIFIILIIIGSLLTVLNFIKKEDIGNSLVYIESIDELSINNGLGFVYKVYNNKNYIVTSYHVIEGYDDIYVYNIKKEKTKAKILNYDEYTDIAILEISNKLNLKEVYVDSNSSLKNKQSIYTIDSENINKKIDGTIKNKNKKITIKTTHGSSNLSVIELNIKVDYGNSGGPVLDKNNKVIGIVFVKEENKNIAYALPINFVFDIVKKLEDNNLFRPNLGATMCNATNIELLNEYDITIEQNVGVVLLELDKFGVLYKFKLKKGDIIIKFDGINVYDVNKLREELYKRKQGDIAEIEYIRDNIYHKANVKL